MPTSAPSSNCAPYSLGRTEATPKVNATEVAEWRWVAGEDLDRELKTFPDTFTPWLKLEWRRLREEFSAAL